MLKLFNLLQPAPRPPAAPCGSRGCVVGEAARLRVPRDPRLLGAALVLSLMALAVAVPSHQGNFLGFPRNGPGEDNSGSSNEAMDWRAAESPPDPEPDPNQQQPAPLPEPPLRQVIQFGSLQPAPAAPVVAPGALLPFPGPSHFQVLHPVDPREPLDPFSRPPAPNSPGTVPGYHRPRSQPPPTSQPAPRRNAASQTSRWTDQPFWLCQTHYIRFLHNHHKYPGLYCHRPSLYVPGSERELSVSSVPWPGVPHFPPVDHDRAEGGVFYPERPAVRRPPEDVEAALDDSELDYSYDPWYPDDVPALVDDSSNPGSSPEHNSDFDNEEEFLDAVEQAMALEHEGGNPPPPEPFPLNPAEIQEGVLERLPVVPPVDDIPAADAASEDGIRDSSAEDGSSPPRYEPNRFLDILNEFDFYDTAEGASPTHTGSSQYRNSDTESSFSGDSGSSIPRHLPPRPHSGGGRNRETQTPQDFNFRIPVARQSYHRDPADVNRLFGRVYTVLNDKYAFIIPSACTAPEDPTHFNAGWILVAEDNCLWREFRQLSPDAFVHQGAQGLPHPPEPVDSQPEGSVSEDRR